MVLLQVLHDVCGINMLGWFVCAYSHVTVLRLYGVVFSFRCLKTDKVLHCILMGVLALRRASSSWLPLSIT